MRRHRLIAPASGLLVGGALMVSIAVAAAQSAISAGPR
jgi:hypothetical protein